MNDIKIFEVFFPSIFNAFLDFFDTKKDNQKNIRLSVMTMIFTLSSLPIEALKANHNEMNVTELYSNIVFICEKMNACTQDYILNNICYIKQPEDYWVQEFITFQQRYNNFIFAYENKTITPESIKDLLIYLIEMYNHLCEVFNKKYQQMICERKTT